MVEIRGRACSLVADWCLNLYRPPLHYFMEPMTDMKGWPNGSLKLTIQEAANIGILNEEELNKLNAAYVGISSEAYTDMQYKEQALGMIRAGDIDEEEAAEWSRWDEKFATMDLDTIRGRMIIEGRDELTDYM